MLFSCYRGAGISKKGFPEGKAFPEGKVSPKVTEEGLPGNPEGGLPCAKGGVCEADGGIFPPHPAEAISLPLGEGGKTEGFDG